MGKQHCGIRTIAIDLRQQAGCNSIRFQDDRMDKMPKREQLFINTGDFKSGLFMILNNVTDVARWINRSQDAFEN